MYKPTYHYTRRHTSETPQSCYPNVNIVGVDWTSLAKGTFRIPAFYNEVRLPKRAEFLGQLRNCQIFKKSSRLLRQVMYYCEAVCVYEQSALVFIPAISNVRLRNYLHFRNKKCITRIVIKARILRTAVLTGHDLEEITKENI